jgi:hypothetical protein
MVVQAYLGLTLELYFSGNLEHRENTFLLPIWPGGLSRCVENTPTGCGDVFHQANTILTRNTNHLFLGRPRSAWLSSPKWQCDSLACRQFDHDDYRNGCEISKVENGAEETISGTEQTVCQAYFGLTLELCFFRKSIKLKTKNSFLPIWPLGPFRCVENTPTGCGDDLPTR